MTPILVVLGGLPGSGKSTIGRILAELAGVAYVRIDSIEQALQRAGELPEDPRVSGSSVGYAVAADNLAAGSMVVADSVNPIGSTRSAWRDVARAEGTVCLEVEIVCSDPVEHRSRVEGRPADIEGHRLPTWQEVVERDYEPWDSADLQIDTAELSAKDAVAAIMDAIRRAKKAQAL